MTSKTKKCAGCGVIIKNAHANRKRCKSCADILLKSPIGRLTKFQEREVRRLAGTMKIKDLAKKVGTSDSTLDRWAKQNGVNINWLSYPKELVEKVCAYYEKNGKVKTSKKFPDVKVRSIVEKYKYFSPRTVRWTDAQLMEAAKMAGLISWKAQAKYFNRPRAFEGSIQSLWNKRFGYRGGSLNGMVHMYSKELVNKNVRYLKPIGATRDGKLTEFRRLILWVDMEKNLKQNVPQFMRKAITSMADFQRWLWKSDNPKPLILKMIKDREIAIAQKRIGC